MGPHTPVSRCPESEPLTAPPPVGAVEQTYSTNSRPADSANCALALEHKRTHRCSGDQPATEGRPREEEPWLGAFSPCTTCCSRSANRLSTTGPRRADSGVPSAVLRLRPHDHCGSNPLLLLQRNAAAEPARGPKQATLLQVISHPDLTQR